MVQHATETVENLISQKDSISEVLKKNNGKYSIYEVKYYSKSMKISEQRKEMRQIETIKGLDVDEVGFVCSSGFEGKIDNVKYIDLNDIFFNS